MDKSRIILVDELVREEFSPYYRDTHHICVSRSKKQFLTLEGSEFHTKTLTTKWYEEAGLSEQETKWIKENIQCIIVKSHFPKGITEERLKFCEADIEYQLRPIAYENNRGSVSDYITRKIIVALYNIMESINEKMEDMEHDGIKVVLAKEYKKQE